jgi:UDP-2,3-diacylglucosamine pyrophosphatase LpxH
MRFVQETGSRTGNRTDGVWRPQAPRNHRALFLSDIHLGSRACRSDRLIEFLRDYCGTHFAGIEVVDSTIHTAADGRRYIVLHGDRFDRLVDGTRRLAPIAHRANLTVIAVNSGFNRMRRWLGLRSWSLLQWAKHKFKTASSYLGDFERSLAELAHELAADGVICGHVHHAAIHEQFGIRYINCGDWVESCTAVAECHDGRFEILRWFGETPRRALAPVTDEVQAA